MPNHVISFRRLLAFILTVAALTVVSAQIHPFAKHALGSQNPALDHFLLAQVEPPSETAVAEPLPEKPAPRHIITGIDIDAGSPVEERVVFSMEGASPPKMFLIDGDPVRLVCDFLGADIGASVKQDIRAKGKMIRRARVGVHQEPKQKVRIVFELAPGRDYEIDEYFRPEESRYELLVRPAGGRAPSESD